MPLLIINFDFGLLHGYDDLYDVKEHIVHIYSVIDCEP